MNDSLTITSYQAEQYNSQVHNTSPATVMHGHFQAVMIHLSYPFSDDTQIVIHVHHKGALYA